MKAAPCLLILVFLVAVLPSTGAEENPFVLRDRLHREVTGQRVLRYSQVWSALETLNAVRESGMVRLIYSRRAEPAAHRDHGQNDPDSWNREHLWPKSHGFPEEDNPAYTDLNNLRPADRSVNTDRRDRDFDEGGVPHPEATRVRWDSDSWEVPDEVKGDVARAVFYMALRYDGSGTWKDRKERQVREPHLVLVEGNSPTDHSPTFGNLVTLLKWNRLDPPDESERERDQGVAQIQGKPNPFVLHPEYIDILWSSGAQ